MTTMMNKKGTAVLAALMCLAVATTTGVPEASAQGKKKKGSLIDKRKRQTDRKALEAARKRQEAKAKLERKENTGPKVATGPKKEKDIFDAENKAGKLTPEEIEKIKNEIEGKNKELITKLESLINQDPTNPSRPEWMFEMAELMWESRNWEYLRERAQYNACLGQMDTSDEELTQEQMQAKCPEPVANYGQAQVIYADILKQYPQYDRLDEVIYRLGRGLIKAKKGAQAIPLLNRLVQNYPDSKYLPEAHLALGEFYFDKNLFGAAKDAYTSVMKHKGYSFYDYAVYKLGWVHYNQKEYRKSIDTFKSVVERKDDTLGFQNQAINDLVVAFSAVDDGWKEAREYFKKQRDIDFTYKKLGQMANYLIDQGKDADSIAIYQWFIKERPDNPKIPDWMESIIISEKKGVNNLEEVERSMNRFIDYLVPGGTWHAKNKANEGAVKNASLLIESSLSYLSGLYHTRAQKDENVDDYAKAATYYEKFIKIFPEKPASFDYNFYLGDIYLLSLKKPAVAVTWYQKVVDMYKAKNIPKGVKAKDAEAFVKDSAYAVVDSYSELVIKHHPGSFLVKMRDTAGKEFKRDELKLDATTAVPEPTELLEYEALFVKASDQWSEMYPKDDVTPSVDYVSAELYKSHNIYDRCIPRYENIMTNHPKHQYASYSGASLLEANYRLKRWADVEKWARYLIKVKNFKVVKKDGLRNTIAYALNERATELNKAKKFDEAADQLLKLADEFSDNKELAPGAIFNAAAIYENGEQIRKAVETFEKVVKRYPTSDKAPEALFAMADIFESRANYDRAAGYFGRLADKKYIDWEDTGKDGKVERSAAIAIFNAGTLYKAMENWDKAISVYENYIEVFGKKKKGDAEVQKNIAYLSMELARLEARRGKDKEAIKRFEKALKRKGIETHDKIEAYAKIGLLTEKLKGKRWEKVSNDYFNKVLATWKKSGAEIKSEEDSYTGKNKQRESRYFAAQVRFLQAERVYEKFKLVKLSFPVKLLQKRLLDKGKLEQEAEKMYFEVITDLAAAADVKDAAPLWIAASAYRIGQMYKNFSDELYALPMPEGLSEDEEFAYQGAIDDNAFPLQEKALSAFQNARKLALKYRAYNEWSAKSSAEISKLEAEKYPITSQEGVATGFSQLQFTDSPGQVKFDTVKERLGARKAEADRKAEEERLRKEAEEKARQKAAEEAAKAKKGA